MNLKTMPIMPRMMMSRLLPQFRERELLLARLKDLAIKGELPFDVDTAVAGVAVRREFAAAMEREQARLERMSRRAADKARRIADSHARAKAYYDSLPRDPEGPRRFRELKRIMEAPCSR